MDIRSNSVTVLFCCCFCGFVCCCCCFVFVSLFFFFWGGGGISLIFYSKAYQCKCHILSYNKIVFNSDNLNEYYGKQ